MHRLSQNMYLRLMKAWNWFMMTLLFDICFWYCIRTQANPEHTLRRILMVTVVYLYLYFTFAKIYDAFLLTITRVSEIVFSQLLSYLIADVIGYIVICIILVTVAPILPFILLLASQFVFSVAWAFLCNRCYFLRYPPKRTAVIYDMREDLDKLLEEYGMTRKYQLDLVMTTEECLRDLDILSDMEVVFLSGVHSSERNVILKYCINHYIMAYMIPRVGDLLMSSAKPVHMLHLPIYRVTHYDPSPFYLFFKRSFDLCVSGLALIILSPVFLVTAIAIKATDGGPVFYKQERMTKDGKKFMIHKFRSMRVDAEKDGVARLSTGSNDDRITPVGHIIRKFRIDELPQLIDILKGDLSVVGPRPEREAIALEYEKEIPEFRLRLQCKAGLTGYAQVYGKYNSTPYDKLQMDLMYIANPSIWEDIRICFATVKILFIPESTEGVAEGATNALGKK
ncbi:MAG: exopolysaccharide biosynthesis polyprenyl glycosylphosphotransferase [Dorea sp.]|nr:exopolysaccharide biosynthesis polyprenyl glycosylphosphotransferase [Dorea sp.]